jgi:ferrochelatase
LKRLAVVLFNVGGPDSLDAVKPFLLNLFSDRAIIGLPQPFRWMVARLIARSRAPTARAIYAQLGGKSPLLDETRAQAAALELRLNQNGDVDTRVFIAMRYWHPFTEEAVAAVKAFAPDSIVLLPLYPQFSTTTTQSSLTVWHHVATQAGLTAPTDSVRSYPTEPGFVAAQAELLRDHLARAQAGRVRVLFSAHGLPQKIVDAGDPYPQEIAKSAAAVAAAAGLVNADWTVCYQSRVGPLKWLTPSLDDELTRAAADKVGVVIVPISFVSEHSETLVELDKDYRVKADMLGVAPYFRVPALGTHPAFIAGLAELVRQALPETDKDVR